MSVALAWPMLTAVPSRLVCSALASSGTVRSGGVVSTTVTVVVPVAWLPESSVAVQVTVVLPRGNVAGASFVISTSASQMSVALAWPMLTAVPSRLVCSAVASSGTVRTGTVVSAIVTVCVSVAELPASSVAVHVTVVVPRGNTSGASLVTMGLGSLSSVTVGCPRSPLVPSRLSCSSVTSLGASISGGVLSRGWVTANSAVTSSTCTVVALRRYLLFGVSTRRSLKVATPSTVVF